MIKKLFIALAFCIVTPFLLGAWLPSNVVQLPCTNSIGASSTNWSVAGTSNITVSSLHPGFYPLFGLSVSANGVAATTNGSLTVYFVRSQDTTSFEAAATSPLKITVPLNGTATVTFMDWAALYGVNTLKVGGIMNTSGGAVSNIQVTVGF